MGRGSIQGARAVQRVTSGAITTTGLVTLLKLISLHISTARPAILRLFQSVIDARTEAYAIFPSALAVVRAASLVLSPNLGPAGLGEGESGDAITVYVQISILFSQ